MANTFINRAKKAWNVFMNRSPTYNYSDIGYGTSYRFDRVRLSGGNERSTVTAIYNRIAVDVAATSIRHVRTDADGRYLYDIDSGLNNCLTVEANLDQSGRAFIQDAALSMLDEGVVALVPTDTDDDPEYGNSFKIESMRVGKIVQWYPKHVRVNLYDENTGKKKDIVLPKSFVTIIENPFYSVMNEPNSTMQRLVRKLNILDVIDEQSGSGKLDLIIQLPYVVKGERRAEQAETRRRQIEEQLTGSKYGIAYTDGTEKITQLNRPVENNLMKQIEYLTSMAYSQMGITQSILDGTANEETMLNYYSRTIEPILSAFCNELIRKYITKTARTQLQTIMYFRDPFRLVPISTVAELGDKFIRNEIMTGNEMRQIVGMKPSKDPNADKLRNPNIRNNNAGMSENLDGQTTANSEYIRQLEELDVLDDELDELELEVDSDSEDDEIKHYASPYYDPEKAHEYYMRTRELSGRRSTAGLNEKGKAAAKYVKEQLNTERKVKTDQHKESTDSEIDSARNETNAIIESHKADMENKIDQLRSQLKRMSSSVRKHNKDRIYGIIDTLRAKNRETRIMLRESFKEQSSGLRDEHRSVKKQLKDEYDEKYMTELEALKNDSDYVNPRRRNKS